MTQDPVRKFTEAEISAWRENIRADTFANYYISMAVAIFRTETAEAALPWLEQAALYPARQAVRICATLDVLRALGRNLEADQLDKSARQKDPVYDIKGLLGLARIHFESACIPPEATIDVYHRAAAAAKATESSSILARIQLEQAVRLLAFNRHKEAQEQWLQAIGILSTLPPNPLDPEEFDFYIEKWFVDNFEGPKEILANFFRFIFRSIHPELDADQISRFLGFALPCFKVLPETERSSIMVALKELVKNTRFRTYESLFSCSQALLHWGFPIDAAVLARRASELNTKDPAVKKTLALSLLIGRQATEAVDVLEHLIAEVGEQPAILSQLAITLIVAEQLIPAGKVLEKALTLAPGDVQSLLYRGLWHLAHDDAAKAAADFQAALVAQPDLAFAHAGLGLSFALQGQGTEAVIRHKKAIEINPKPFEWISYGFTLDLLGQPQEADAAYRAAVLARPDHVWYLAKALPQQFDRIRIGLERIGYKI